jgi:glycosyltransferase involved in cell wall biosynthesis
VDAKVFRPSGPAFRPPTARGFVFLYVGGTILRKGIDVLLRAYSDAFTVEDDVTLIVKDVGSRSFYAHNNRLGHVIEATWRADAAHTHLLTEEMSDESLAALYRGANALVSPYRGEGFGMPIVEAMACGTPAIVTEAGPSLEFCAADDTYFIPAREVPVPETPPPLGEFSGPWTWYEPDVVSLALTMRQVYEHADEAKRRGILASERILQKLSWEKILPLYHARIEALTS